MKSPQAQTVLAVTALALWLAAPAPAWALREDTLGLYSDTQGPVYRVGVLVLEYAREHPLHPSIEVLRNVDFVLGEAEDGYVGPRRGGDNVWFSLREIEQGAPIRLYASGLRELNEQLVAEYNRRGLIGVYVAPHPDDIDPPTGADLRPPDQSTLRLVAHTGRAAGLRTFATRRGLADDERSNRDAHTRLRDGSPVQPVGTDGRRHGDLLLRDELDEYLAYLNRHPGRRVDVSITPTSTPGDVYVDYLVAEERPWTVYSQWANTGTEATTDNRQRFGYSNTQLTKRDDSLRVDYVTGDLDDVNSVFGSYELPFRYLARTRLRFTGGWIDYDASQFGLGDKFEGTSWSLGTELVTNIYQDDDLFLDLSSGARFLNVEVTNVGSPTGEEDFVIPSLALRLERLRDTSTLVASLGVEGNLSSLAGTSSDEADLFLLGRPDIDDDWALMRWNAGYSFYLEPLLNGRAWHDRRTPGSSTLAHELALRTSGQYAFDTRLIPQTQHVLGGLYTVRGYPQATVASDSAVLVSAEYSYHLPRSFRPAPPRALPGLGAFRVAPERVFGRPDWDLILRGFFDWGRAIWSGSVGGEDDETLSSLGVGIELVLRHNLSVRLDYGIALSEVRDVDSGHSETYFVATFRY